MADRRIRTALRWLAPLVVVGMLGACTSVPPTPAPTTSPSAAPRPATLSFSHEPDASGVSPAEPVTVAVMDGALERVTLTDDADRQIAGALSADRRSWTSVAALSYASRYTLTVSAVGVDGQTIEATRAFRTVAVKRGFYWGARFSTAGPDKYYIQHLDGGTYGVGQPIVVWFTDVVDKKVAEAALTVATTPYVEGAWSWINDREVHWRPKEYWPAGTKVTVEAKTFGVPLTSPSGGRQLWGEKDAKASFSIGRSKIAKVDNKTKQMRVYIDGELVKTMPVSLGRDGTYAPDHFTNPATGRTEYYRTYSGVHVVTVKHAQRLMSGVDASGPWSTLVDWAVRITDSGVYVHSAPWSVWAQGSINVSHGCINVSPENAEWFFKQFGVGDVVEVVNTGRNLYEGNGTTDWIVPWDEWLAGSALPPTTRTSARMPPAV